jgi:hypothetical protein
LGIKFSVLGGDFPFYRFEGVASGGLVLVVSGWFLVLVIV